MQRTHQVLAFAIAFAGAAHAAPWPQFRGPSGSGLAENGDLPVHFGPDSNVVWKAAVPAGHSSPVVASDRIFLTAFDNNELLTLALDPQDGRVLWRRSLPPDKIERGARHSHPATSTPCTEGKNLYVYFGSFGAAAYDFDGKELWRRPLPVPITQHGASSSPVLAGDLLILQRDADVDSHLLALKTSDGSVAWRTSRPDARRGFSTPMVLGNEIIVPGTLRVAAYDVKNGAERWTVRGFPNEMCSSPVFGDGLIFVAGWTHGSGVPVMPTFDSLLERGDANKDGKLTRAEAPAGPAKQHFLYIDANKDETITRDEWNTMSEIFSNAENVAKAIRPGGKGDVTATHVAWSQKRGLPYVPTPLVYRQRLYLIKNGGLLSCYHAGTGEALYAEERIGALGDYYSSPVAANNKVCVISQSGVATILQAGDELAVLARNELKEMVLATPAIVGRTIYIRTASTLYAFGQGE